MLSKLANVVGAGGHAKVVITTLRAAGFTVGAVYDDDLSKIGQSVAEVPVVGPIDQINPGTAGGFVIAIGSNSIRRQVATRLAFAHWLTAVHPRAIVHESVSLGEGTLVFAGAAVQPDTRLGSHCIVNTSASVDHDCCIGAFSHLAPGCHLAGAVTLGDGVFMGIGSAVVPGVHIGEWSTIGAGGVVIENVPANCVAVGVPAKMQPASSSR
jgi:sugar O-acyltransferase (sialic acid O-acetyltransferase NeuD family)